MISKCDIDDINEQLRFFEPGSNRSASYYLNKADIHLKDRAALRDSEDGERSMKACVEAFNALTGHYLLESQGWLFMELLKAARSMQGAYHEDDYEDGVAYAALRAEAAYKENT